MSENLELVRSIFADWERGDFFARADWADPNIEFVLADGPDPGSFRGIASMAEAWANRLRPWNDYRPEAEEFRELDGECVLVLIWHRGRGKASGIDFEEVRTPGATLFVIRDGKVTRLVPYWDRDRALAYLGLEA